MAMSPPAPTPEARFVQDLLRPVSQERLDKYRPPSGSDLDMLVNYYWNIALCQALYPALDCVEVALRNTIHMTLTDYYGTEYWFDDLRIVRQAQFDDAQEARRKLIRRRQSANAGKIVAELNFGFWVQILTKHYEAPIWSPNRFALMLTAFPNVSRNARKPRSIQGRYFKINLLRNRVFHFEPIWHRTNLPQEHLEVLDAIDWISPRQAEAVRLFDTFQTTYRDGIPEVRAKIEGYLVGRTS
ncbi:MAG: hypothetical protein M9890_12465 [Thermomicrobiales bacterium]|nr:hypothetical protein [Thermomicrobiales bacterium]